MTEERDINRFDCANESLHEQVKSTKLKGCGIDSLPIASIEAYFF